MVGGVNWSDSRDRVWYNWSVSVVAMVMRGFDIESRGRSGVWFGSGRSLAAVPDWRHWRLFSEPRGDSGRKGGAGRDLGRGREGERERERERKREREREGVTCTMASGKTSGTNLIYIG